MHPFHFGQTYPLAIGDQTIGSLVSLIGELSFAAKVYVWCETEGPISLAIRAAPLTALEQGKQISYGDWMAYQNVDLNLLRVFASGAADRIYVEVEMAEA